VQLLKLFEGWGWGWSCVHPVIGAALIPAGHYPCWPSPLLLKLVQLVLLPDADVSVAWSRK
jgi:hypothetical protein